MRLHYSTGTTVNVHLFENMLSKFSCNNAAGAHLCTKSAVHAPPGYLPLASLSGDKAMMLLLEISHPALFTDRCHGSLDFYFELSTTGEGLSVQLVLAYEGHCVNKENLNAILK